MNVIIKIDVIYKSDLCGNYDPYHYSILCVTYYVTKRTQICLHLTEYNGNVGNADVSSSGPKMAEALVCIDVISTFMM